MAAVVGSFFIGEIMKVSCQYCGRIHDKYIKCSAKPVRENARTISAKFHHSRKWSEKAKDIKKRDNYLCQVCIRNLYDTVAAVNDLVEVHHIDKIETDYERRLDDENLITLCVFHHKMADCGKIPKQVLFDIVKEITRIKDTPGDMVM